MRSLGRAGEKPRRAPSDLGVREAGAKHLKAAETAGGLGVGLGVPAGALAADASGQFAGAEVCPEQVSSGVQVGSGGGGPGRPAAGA